IVHDQRSAASASILGPYHECLLQRQHNLGSGPTKRGCPGGWSGNQSHQLESCRGASAGFRQHAGQHRVDAVPDSGWTSHLTNTRNADSYAQLRTSKPTVQRTASIAQSLHGECWNDQWWSTCRRHRDAQRSGSGGRRGRGLLQRLAFGHAASFGDNSSGQLVSLNLDSDESSFGKHGGQHQRQLERNKLSGAADDYAARPARIHRTESGCSDWNGRFLRDCHNGSVLRY
ncbi:MAG: hypothetical protein JWM83_2181, partial [Candidatus Angelobacter sp.]|nr:hypothetical protein [Candidatus Angelobacter sp.]